MLRQASKDSKGYKDMEAIASFQLYTHEWTVLDTWNGKKIKLWDDKIIGNLL